MLSRLALRSRYIVRTKPTLRLPTSQLQRTRIQTLKRFKSTEKKSYPVPPVFSSDKSRVVFDAPPISIKKKWLKRIFGTLALLGAGSAALVYMADEGLWRTLTVVGALLPMIIDYQILLSKVKHLPEDLQKPHFDDYHKKWAKEPLRLCLDLRGFYVKMGQIAGGQPDILPQPYVDHLKILQENVPPQPFETIKAIVESELGCSIEEAFKSFAKEPLGAASIGQVHLAEMFDGTKVIVKVQYPETERFFRLDFNTMKRIFGFSAPDMVPVLDQMEGCFEQVGMGVAGCG